MNGESVNRITDNAEGAYTETVAQNTWGDYVRTRGQIIECERFLARRYKIVKGEGEYPNELDGVFYWINPKESGDGFRGFARSFVISVRDYLTSAGRIWEDQFGIIGLQPEDKLILLTNFSPNGPSESAKEEDMRKGVGAEALNLIISDEINSNARAIFVTSLKEPMQKFLEKKGFVPLKNDEPTFYKVLESSEKEHQIIEPQD